MFKKIIIGTGAATVVGNVAGYIWDEDTCNNDNNHTNYISYKTLFGTADTHIESRSLVNISWGVLHDSHDRPHHPLVPKQKLDLLIDQKRE